MTFDKEAALTWGGIAAAVGAAVVLLKTFGVNITDAQADALQNFVTIALPIVTALIIRGFVYSKSSVRAKVDESFQDAKQGATEPPKVL